MKTEFLKSTAWNIIIACMLIISGTGFSSCSDDDDKDLSPVNYTITLDKTSESVQEGDEFVITPTFSHDDAKKLNYIWTSSNKKVATVFKNYDNSVRVKALATGNVEIKIECPDRKEITASCMLTITEKPYEYNGPIRILAIGNSFSQDAVEQYLYNLAKAEDIETIIANLYIGGCSLERHLTNAKEDKADYEYRKIIDGNKTNRSNMTLAQALADEEWDYISLQQASGFSGQYETYVASLPELVEYVKDKATNEKMKLMLHQTWAYAANSTHDDFPKYDKDQTKMYNAIIDAVNQAATLVGIDIIIPSGTAIQNGRTSFIGDNFTRDGYHLETTYGRYTAACTWFEKIFGKNVVGNAFTPEGLHATKAAIAQNAAHAAVQKPDEVTILTDYVNPPVDTEVLKAPIYIDFGSAMSGSPWNNVTSNITTTEGTPLIDEDGDYTKFKIRISKKFSSVYGGVGSEPAGPINIGFEVPVGVYKDGLMVSDNNPGEVEISNLDPSLKYTLTIVGLRWNSSVTRTTDYKITGKDTETQSLAVGTNKADEVANKYVTFDNIFPDATGNIYIEVTRNAENPHQALINALHISLAN